MEQGKVKRLKIRGFIFFSLFSLFNNVWSLGPITQQMMKEIIIFLSRDGIILEELNLSLKEKEKEKSHFNTKQARTSLGIVNISLKD